MTGSGPHYTLRGQLRETAGMIKVAHSVFALPFALAAMALAMRSGPGWSWRVAGWIVCCAVAARTAAMSANRLIDARLDAANPRTAARALPAGRVTPRFVAGLLAVSAALFVFGAGRLNRVCLYLSPVALAVLLAYPFAKRFTVLCHFWLGLCLALAPLGAWLAVLGTLRDPATPLLMGAAVLAWTAGFDLIYACQDAAHDRAHGLRSLPAAWGVARALRLSSALHVASLGCLAALYAAQPGVLGWLYGAGLAAAAAMLVYEHAIVSADDLGRVNVAFFTLNGAVSLVLGAATALDALL